MTDKRIPVFWLIAALFAGCAAGLTFYRFDHVIFLILVTAIVLAFLSTVHPVAYLSILLVVHDKIFKTFDFGLPLWFYGDVTLLLLGIGIVTQLIVRPRRLMTVVRDPYAPYAAGILALVAFSLVWGNFFTFLQPPKDFISGGRPYLLYAVFLYLFLVDFNPGQMKQFLNFALASALLVVGLLLVDVYLFGGHKIFKLALADGILASEARGMRISAYLFMSVWSMFYACSLLRRGQAKGPSRAFLVFAVLAILYNLMFIGMGRQTLAALAVTFLILCARRPVWLLMALGVCAAALMLGLLVNVNYRDTFFFRLLAETVEEFRQAGHEGNVAIRLQGLAYFFQYAKQAYFLGMGIHSSTAMTSPVRIGLEMGYNFADLGLFAAFFRFGAQAVLFMIFLLARMFRDLKRVIREGPGQERILAESIYFTLISMVVLVPSCTAFFKESEVFYYGILLYFVSKLASGASQRPQTS